MTKGQKARQRQRRHKETLECIMAGLVGAIVITIVSTLAYFGS